MYGDENLRCKSYPRFSASLSDIKRDLDILEYTEGFIPDMIIIDYANILKPERHYDESRYSIDETWKELGGMCAERHCIIVTANQLNRGGLKKRQTEEEDVAEWIGMLGHVDVTLAMSQTPLERDENILRLGLLGHRHKKFSKTETCAVLQQLEVGQTYLDSEIIR